MKKLSIVLVIVMIMSMLLCACKDNGLVGSWSAVIEGAETTMTFEKDGTGSMKALGGLLDAKYYYKQSDDIINITAAEGFEDVISETDFTYTLKGDTLTLVNGEESMELTRDKEEKQ